MLPIFSYGIMNDNEGAVTTRHMTTMHNTTVTITHDNYVKVHEGANTMTIERRKGAVERRRSAQGFGTEEGVTRRSLRV